MNFECIASELRSRIVFDGERTYVAEFPSARWTLEVEEVDKTFSNGYFGMYAVLKSVPELGVTDDLCTRLLAGREMRVNPDGYHLGRPIWDRFLSANGELPLRTSVITEAMREPSADLFGGKAGSLLGQLLSEGLQGGDADYSVSWLCNALSSTDSTGFAHGRMGICFSLLAFSYALGGKTSLFWTIADSVRPVLENAVMAAMEKPLNLALCSGGIASLVIASHFETVYGAGIVSRAQRDVLKKKIFETLAPLPVRTAPLHLCCGISGLIDMLLEMSESVSSLDVFDIALEVGERFFVDESIERIGYTGVLHGLCGVAYQMARLSAGRTSTERLPSLIFPPIRVLWRG